MKRYTHAAWLFVPLLSLTGCMLPRPGKARVVQLEVVVAPDANDTSVVPFDTVAVRDKKLLKQIAAMDASAWFGAKGRCTYRGSGKKADVQFHTWEFVPGQVFHIQVPIPGGTKGLLGFASYQTPGTHRVELKDSGSQTVNMGENGMQALPKALATSTEPPAPEKLKVCPDD
ncbi:hypothetical protein [Silvibacterium sp.]|uniref:hypothetical protein n=1 Tax=Silvibacterium sp. TaxID=1964179 RepID=UPI0039E4F1AB